jgi:cytoplasmic iron level regulating protein YaaA (DUF328/UPF0246 family)
MARYIVQNKIDQPELLKDFTEDGYRFSSEKVAKNGVMQLVFVRD